MCFMKKRQSGYDFAQGGALILEKFENEIIDDFVNTKVRRGG